MNTRARRPRGSLTPEAILDAAEAVAVEDADALSMRAVAARLGAAPMALYNHFATKEQLVGALLDRILGRYEATPATDDWLADLRAFAHAHRRLLVEHPWAVPLLFTRPNPGPGAVRIGGHALGILQRGGLDDDHAVAAFSGVIALNYGWSSFTTARDLDPASAREVQAYASDEHYAFVLDQLVAGLEITGSRGETGRAAARTPAPPRRSDRRQV